MKYIYIAILSVFISPNPLLSLVELEEVRTVYPDGGTSKFAKVYMNSDTVLIHTKYSTSDNPYDLFLSTDGGESWRDITQNLLPIASESFYDGRYSELGAYYFNVERKDTSVVYYNLDGELIKKSYPADKSFRGVEFLLNPLDENFMGFFHSTFDWLHRRHYHRFSITTDRGETWHYVSPKTNSGFAPLTITYRFSSAVKNRILFSYDWSDVYISSGGANFILDSYTKEYKSVKSSVYKNYCFECVGENKSLYVEKGYDNFRLYNNATDENTSYHYMGSTLGLDADSIAQNDGQRLYNMGRVTNLRSPNHQVLGITHFKELGGGGTPDEYEFVRQYFFQTFDFGITWELIYENMNENDLIKSYYISPNSTDFWVVRGEQEEPDFQSDTEKHVLYKSKEPLTSVTETQTKDNFEVSILNSNLSIISNDYYQNASIKIYSLEGKQLLSTVTNLQQGANEVTLTKIIDRLVLVSVTINRIQKSTFKLINNK